MNTLMIFSSILAVAFARTSFFFSPHIAALTIPYPITKLLPGTPIGLDGRAVDTPEVALAKVEHSAAYTNERIAYAIRAAETAAPLGPDGRVVDTPEVAIAKAEHASAHLNEKFNRLSEASKRSYEGSVLASAYSSPVYYKYLI